MTGSANKNHIASKTPIHKGAVTNASAIQKRQPVAGLPLGFTPLTPRSHLDRRREVELALVKRAAGDHPLNTKVRLN